MSDPRLHDQISLITREWAKQYSVGEDKAGVLVDRIWPAIEKVLLVASDFPGEGKAPESSGPTKE
jgi:hypothetical protein